MSSLFFGIDVSKGYADFCCINHAGSRIGEIAKFDDTPKGHAAAKSLVENLRIKHPDSQMVFGLENSGGLERNWAVFLRDLGKPFDGKVYTLNPLAVKKFLDRELHRTITDRVSAQGIANYLRQGMRPVEVPFEDSLAGPTTLYRCLRNAISRSAETQNEMQSLLPRVQPELVQFCRHGLPDWVLKVIQHWPIASKLAMAKVSQLKKISYVTEERAQKLISAAKESVGAQVDSYTELTVSFLAKEILHEQESIETMKKQVIDSLAEDEGVKIIRSIPGIGAWGATCLRIEIGSIVRFRSSEALVAFAGLDPRIKQSGDSIKHIGISRRGRRQIRAILYPLILAAVRCNPVIKEFYARLRAKGKGHLVSATACMRKMLHIIYGCWISGKCFDKEHEQTLKASKQETQPTQTVSEENKAKERIYVLNPEAPISRREAAKRRKAVFMPQTAINRRERGPETASELNDTQSPKNLQTSEKI